MGHGDSAKLLSNSLVGRIGASGRSWQDVPGAFHPKRWDHWYSSHPTDSTIARWRTISGRVQVETITGVGDESIPAISAYVYSWGRVRLWKWLKAAGAENLLYCDTDSVWTTPAGLSKIEAAGLLRPGQLGGLRVKATHARARFFGIRHYETPAGVKWSGVPRNCVSGSEDGWSYTYSESPGESARHWREPDGRLIEIAVPDRRGFTGGRLSPDGSVCPIEVFNHGEASERQRRGVYCTGAAGPCAACGGIHL